MTFDQCTPGMTFEVEIIRHFEGTTDDESMSLQKEVAKLITQPTALELLRTSEMRFIEVFEPEDLRRWFAGGYHRGIFDNNVIQNVTEMVKSGLSNISDTLNLKKNW